MIKHMKERNKLLNNKEQVSLTHRMENSQGLSG